MHRNRTVATASGFTLVELIITIAIAAILLAIALPSFKSSIRSNRVATRTNSLIATFNLARTEAIRNNHGAGVCPSSAGTSCNGVDWDQGWLVWSDEDASGTLDADETVIRYVQPAENLDLVSAQDKFVFDRRGRLTEPAGTAQLVLKPADCPVGAKLHRTIVVSTVGQVRYEKGPCSS